MTKLYNESMVPHKLFDQTIIIIFASIILKHIINHLRPHSTNDKTIGAT